jgi:hypothetical protein
MDIPALPSLLAKLLVLLDQTMGLFASVTETAASGACNITVYNATINECGQALIDTLGDLIFHGAQLLSQLIKATEGIS